MGQRTLGPRTLICRRWQNPWRKSPLLSPGTITPPPKRSGPNQGENNSKILVNNNNHPTNVNDPHNITDNEQEDQEISPENIIDDSDNEGDNEPTFAEMMKRAQEATSSILQEHQKKNTENYDYNDRIIPSTSASAAILSENDEKEYNSDSSNDNHKQTDSELLDTLQKQYDTLQDTYNELKNNNELQQEEIVILNTTIQSLKEQIENLEKQLLEKKQLSILCKTQDKAIRAVKKEQQSYIQQIEELKAQVAIEETKTISPSTSSNTTVANELKRKLQSTQADLTLSKQANENLKQENTNLKLNLSSFQQGMDSIKKALNLSDEATMQDALIRIGAYTAMQGGNNIHDKHNNISFNNISPINNNTPIATPTKTITIIEKEKETEPYEDNPRVQTNSNISNKEHSANTNKSISMTVLNESTADINMHTIDKLCKQIESRILRKFKSNMSNDEMRSWMRHFKQACEDLCLMDDHKIKIFRLLCDPSHEPTQLGFLSLEATKSWAQLETHLDKLCGKKDPAIALHKLRSLRQTSTITAYYAEFIAVLSDCNIMSDHEKVSYFLAGLNDPNIQDKCVTFDSTFKNTHGYSMSLDQMQYFAIECEQNKLRTQQLSKAHEALSQPKLLQIQQYSMDDIDTIESINAIRNEKFNRTRNYSSVSHHDNHKNYNNSKNNYSNDIQPAISVSMSSTGNKEVTKHILINNMWATPEHIDSFVKKYGEPINCHSNNLIKGWNISIDTMKEICRKRSHPEVQHIPENCDWLTRPWSGSRCENCGWSHHITKQCIFKFGNKQFGYFCEEYKDENKYNDDHRKYNDDHRKYNDDHRRYNDRKKQRH